MITGKEFKRFIKDMDLFDDDFVAIDEGGLTLVILNSDLQEEGHYEVGGISEENDNG